MIICGLKLTHDGAIAVIENNRLVFSTELEKVNNNPRYTGIEDTSIIDDILSSEGYSIDDVDEFVVDGWGGYDSEALALQPRLDIGANYNTLQCNDGDDAYKLPCAQYEERSLGNSILECKKFLGLKIKGKTYHYSSFLHVTGHVCSAYCTSPFAAKNEDSFVLIWDGGMYPRFYYVHAHTMEIENLGPLFLLIGNCYTIFSQHFGPFKVQNGFAKDNLSVAGKVMAYIALGKIREELFVHFEEIFKAHFDAPMGFANIWAAKFKERFNANEYSDEDVLASFHKFLELFIIQKLRKKLERVGARTMNLCIAGGCALNIKWNSAIRGTGLFEDVFVPPFPNDSGSAIGMAAARMMESKLSNHVTWSVYSGPNIQENTPDSGWKSSSCTLPMLATLLYESNEPVVFLNKRAELGPRALGNRSIIASPASSMIKQYLNEIKLREHYRPISPICLEEDAPKIFSPGTPDPYMLFDHQVKPEWLSKIPGVIHLDQSARLQTVNKQSNLTFWILLNEFKSLSGIPLLCNTSANHKECGFFPDVYSATSWGKTNYVWCDNMLYEKSDKKLFDQKNEK